MRSTTMRNVRHLYARAKCRKNDRLLFSVTIRPPLNEMCTTCRGGMRHPSTEIWMDPSESGGRSVCQNSDSPQSGSNSDHVSRRQRGRIRTSFLTRVSVETREDPGRPGLEPNGSRPASCNRGAATTDVTARVSIPHDSGGTVSADPSRSMLQLSSRYSSPYRSATRSIAYDRIFRFAAADISDRAELSLSNRTHRSTKAVRFRAGTRYPVIPS